MNRPLALFLLLVGVAGYLLITPHQAPAQTSGFAHTVEVGDTWLALSRRYRLPEEMLRAANPDPNPFRQPAIGDTILIPAEAGNEQFGRLLRPSGGGLLEWSVRLGTHPALLATQNDLDHIYRPLLGRALWLRGGDAPPRELPAGFQSLELSAVPARPGEAVAWRARARGISAVSTRLDNLLFDGFVNGDHVLGLGGTGAFFRPGTPELMIQPEGAPAWYQPWRFEAGTWDFDQITLTGEAAEIDQEAIAAERARLFTIWSRRNPVPQWQQPFQLPIEQYLRISSTFGARRSYNGGPYSSYHEGVDFSAYAGTPVYASGAGTVVLAEHLYVRGGAVIVDHGLGIYSGYYHMSAVHAYPGQVVQPGDLVGEVGTEGLSSGNHLHWDLLVAETWVDAAAWRAQRMDCWILEGWGTPCVAPPGG